MATVNRIIRNFKDLDLSFEAHPFTKDLVVKRDKEAIKNAIKNLILTRHYERPFHPEIGCQIHNMLFENFTPISRSIMEQSISDVINKFEPRARIIQIDVDDDPDDNEIDINIIFTYANVSEPITVNFSVSRVR